MTKILKEFKHRRKVHSPENSYICRKHNKNMKEIYLAGGCFWGMEHFLQFIKGVEQTEVGYANSIRENPTYEMVCSGDTHAAETVKVLYNPAVLSLKLLLETYFKAIDPTSINKQGGDEGLQYRTGIYYTSAADLETINGVMKEVGALYTRPIVTEVKPLENFYPAEDYHQDYLDKNPSGYCHIRQELFKLAKEVNN